jgi:predicted RNA binding protein YcfA (HicA-like mRNA interferase family)
LLFETSSQCFCKGVGKITWKIGYEVSRQKGSHIRLTCNSPKVHHITIPNHDPIKVGTLATILSDIAAFRNQGKESLISEIFG